MAEKKAAKEYYFAKENQFEIINKMAGLCVRESVAGNILVGRLERRHKAQRSSALVVEK